MDNSIFAQSIGRIRALETKLISNSKFDSLADSSDYQDCLRMLQDTKYGKYVSMPSYEDGLTRALQDLYREMYLLTPVREVVDIMAIRYDCHNIKCIIKGELSGMDIESCLIEAGTIPIQNLKFMIKDHNYKELPEVIKTTITEAYREFKEKNSPQYIDMAVDRGMFRYMFEKAKNSGLDFLSDFTSLVIDSTNIKTFIRLKSKGRGPEILEKAFIPGGHLQYDFFISLMNEPIEKFSAKIIYTNFQKWSSGAISEFLTKGDTGLLDKFGDNYILDYLKGSKFVSIGPEPIVSYIYAVENEIKLLRIILTGKLNGLSPDIIRERLREAYV